MMVKKDNYLLQTHPNPSLRRENAVARKGFCSPSLSRCILSG